MEEHINDHDIEDILERIDDTVEHRLRATKTMKNIFIVYYIYSEIVMKQRISSRVHVHETTYFKQSTCAFFSIYQGCICRGGSGVQPPFTK